MSATDNIITRIYSNFRGADFRGLEVNLLRSPDCFNVWKDYKNTESIRTRPALEKFTLLPQKEKVYGIFFYDGRILAHIGTGLYEIMKGNYSETGEWISTFSPLYIGLNESASSAFIYDNIFYLKDGLHYFKYDGETIRYVEGYIPTTTIGRKPEGGGTKHEDVNMISPYRKNSFLADGVSFSFFLDTINIDSSYPPIVEVNGETVPSSLYEVDYEQGKIEFIQFPPDTPATDGKDNVFITFKKDVPKYKECIEKCTLLQVFDNRVFFSGNPDYPNMVWHSSLDDPSYVSDLDYYNEGMDNAAVKGLVAGNNALWVFREPSASNTTVFYHTPAIDDTYGKVYPSSHSSITTGCVGKAINFNDDIVFFSERGMEGISGDITTEQMIAHRSSVVDNKLTTEKDYSNMVLTEWEGYLIVFIGNKAYLADSRAVYTNVNHFEYEWFYWELEEEVTCATVINGDLYLGTKNGGVYTLTDTTSAIESYWTTPLDKFDYPHRLKTTNKRGCVVEATGDISVYAKLENTDFELIGTYENITDYFVSRIKRKKFKDIQLKFYSNNRFSLETASIEVFIGGYIKR